MHHPKTAIVMTAATSTEIDTICDLLERHPHNLFGYERRDVCEFPDTVTLYVVAYPRIGNAFIQFLAKHDALQYLA